MTSLSGSYAAGERSHSLLDAADDVLAEMAREGDRFAFDILCDRDLPVVYKRLRMKLPPSAVDDVTQEVFLAATRSIKRFRGDASFSTWILRIAQYKIADFYRGEERQPETVPFDPTLNQGAHSDRWKEVVAVESALAQLPEHYQAVLLLRFAEGLPFKKVAQRLGISLEAAKSRYRRAVAAVAEELQVGAEG